MKISNEKVNLGKVYFIYLFLVLFLQIIGYSSKGSMFDTLWKAGVITGTMFFVFNKTGGRVTKKIVIPLIIYTIAQVVALFLSGFLSISSIVNIFVILAMSYLFISVSSSLNGFKMNHLNWFINAFICLMIYAVLFNFITNPSSVLDALSNNSAYSNMMSSFFDNKQTFGMFLFMGFIVSVWGYVISRKKIYIITLAVFFLNLFLCLSRTALFACLTFIILVILFSFRPNKKLSLQMLFAVLCICGIVWMIPSLRIFIVDIVLDTNDTVNARSNIWEDAFQAMKGWSIIFGYGEGNASYAIALTGKYANSHNGIIQVLLTGGIIKLALYICVLVNSLISIHKIKKYNASLSAIFLATLISVCAYSMGEALVLLDSSAPCVVASILCIGLPLAIERYYILCNE